MNLVWDKTQTNLTIMDETKLKLTLGMKLNRIETELTTELTTVVSLGIGIE
jgi:hypothetical protein